MFESIFLYHEKEQLQFNGDSIYQKRGKSPYFGKNIHFTEIRTSLVKIWTQYRYE